MIQWKGWHSNIKCPNHTNEGAKRGNGKCRVEGKVHQSDLHSCKASNELSNKIFRKGQRPTHSKEEAVWVSLWGFFKKEQCIKRRRSQAGFITQYIRNHIVP